VSFDKNGWQSCSSENCPDSLWSFYGILERFLSIGPAYNPKGKSVKLQSALVANEERFVIKTLEVDIVTPSCEFTVLASDDIESQNVFSLSTCVFENFRKFLDTLVRMDPPHLGDRWPNRDCRALTFSLLYERIGTIRLLHDGQFEQEWSLGDLIKTVQYDSSFWVHPWLPVSESGLLRIDPERSFRRWKEYITRNRKKKLPVITLNPLGAGPEDFLEEKTADLNLGRKGKTPNPRSRRNLRKERASKRQCD
jgi:hypothetical protein